MFDRYTADARRTVVLAQEEARMLQHNYVGTEHLLLALTRDQGAAGKALADTGITNAEASERIVEIIGHGHSSSSGHIPFTPRAKAVLEEAFRAALSIGHNYIGSEHLLVGLTNAEKSVSSEAILRCGVAPITIRRRLAELMDGAPEPKPETGFALSA